MIAAILAGLTGASLATAVAAVLYARASTKFLREQAIDERNQRMHEQRSLIARLNTAPSLDRAAPELVPIEDPAPYISDFEQDDDRYQAYIEELHPAPNGDGGPAPVIREDT